MIDFEELLSTLRQNLAQILGLGMLTLVVTAELVFAFTQILPAVRANGELAPQVVEARSAINPPGSEADKVAALQAQLSTMRESFDEEAAVFLSEAEVPIVVNHLYRYAEESGVQITQIEAARSAGQDASAGATHSLQSFQVEVSGPALQLVDFVTRLEEAALPTVVIDQLAIKPGKAAEGVSLLTMDLLFYTSPYATGETSIAPQP